MASVYIVHSEIGWWSELTVNCEGVFSTFEKAESWIKAQSIPSYLYRKTMERDGWVKTEDVWSIDRMNDRNDRYEKENYELLRTEVIVPTSTDGKTYAYDKSHLDRYKYVKTFYIIEMDLDPEIETTDVQQ